LIGQIRVAALGFGCQNKALNLSRIRNPFGQLRRLSMLRLIKPQQEKSIIIALFLTLHLHLHRSQDIIIDSNGDQGFIPIPAVDRR
jgi:hypothetical protein